MDTISSDDLIYLQVVGGSTVRLGGSLTEQDHEQGGMDTR
jgi:hypothetical protein